MNTTITIPSAVTPEQVTESRAAFVGALSSAYGAGRTYAGDLLAWFDSLGFGVAWITMAHDHKGADGDAMRAERDTLYKGLKDAGHTNPSVKWKQIKDHAQSILAEQAKAERMAAGEPEPEAEPSGNAKSVRSTQLRLIEDLTALYKHCKTNAQKLTEPQRKAQLHIGAALADLSVDLSTL